MGSKHSRFEKVKNGQNLFAHFLPFQIVNAPRERTRQTPRMVILSQIRWFADVRQARAVRLFGQAGAGAAECPRSRLPQG